MGESKDRQETAFLGVKKENADGFVQRVSDMK